MSQRLLATTCAALIASALLATGASAREAQRDAHDADAVWNRLQAGLDLRAAPPPLSTPSDPTRLRPVSGRAVAPGFAGVKLWASGAGYAVGRRSAGYGLQGGAAVALNEAVDLTASYRLTGYALGDSLDAELADVDERSGAPFLGLDIEF